jgi:hypothetical protein
LFLATSSAVPPSRKRSNPAAQNVLRQEACPIRAFDRTPPWALSFRLSGD